jgi:uncharacterized protein
MREIQYVKNKRLLSILDDLKQMGTGIFGDKLKEIILYGSYARNKQTPGSDLDIMFIFDESSDEIVKYRDDIADIMVELSLKYDMVVSIAESSIDDFNRYIDYVPFYSNIYNEGVEIYAA